MHESKTLDILDAAKHGDTKRVAALLADSPDLVDASGEYDKTPLHWTAERDHAEVARLLLDAGADVERLTTWGSSALEWAAIMGSVAVAEILLSHGATGLNLVTAAGLGRLDEVRTFCDENASVVGLGIPRRPNDVSDENGWPADAAHMTGDVLGEAFQLACRNGEVDVANYLLLRGAGVNSKGYFGGTGLHWAAINGHRHMVEFLLEHNADLTMKDHGLQATPAGWASEGGHDEIAMLIKSREGGLEIER